MPYSNKYIKGEMLVTCDVCGFDYRLSQMRKGVAGSQKGLNVCPKDFDPEHPRDNPPKLRSPRTLEVK